MDDINVYSRWGFLGTLVWGLVIAIVFVVSQIVVLVLYIYSQYKDVVSEEYIGLITELQYNGTVISISSIVTLLVCCPMIIGIVKLKRNSNIKHYLGFKKVELKSIKYWFLVLILLIIASDLLTLFIDKPLVPEFMSEAYVSVYSLWLLWLAIIVAAPIFEELFFRGFLMSGLSSSFVGPIGAIIITSLFWAIIHFQYDLYGVATIFILGLVLGFAKVKTDSILLTISMHSFMNIVAMIEATVYFG